MKFEKRLAVVFFLSIILIELFLVPVLLPPVVKFVGAWDIGIIISEDIIIIPALLCIGIWFFINMWKEYHNLDYESISIGQRLMLNPVKIRTLFWTVVLTIVMGPVASLANAISLLFTDNVIIEQTNEIMMFSFPVTFFVVAVFGPACEEVAFRGLVYGGYRRCCRPRAAVLMSALMFGLMHLNFNQFSYAFVLGIAMALLVEASGSIWTSFLFHLLTNGSSVVYMYLIDGLTDGMLSEIAEQEVESSMNMLPSIGFLALVSVLMIWIASRILKRISAIEKRDDVMDLFIHSREYKGDTVWSLLLIVTIALYLGVMVYEFMAGL